MTEHIAPPSAIGVVLAAGQGLRFGGPRPKQFLPLNGKRVIDYPIAQFLAHPAISEVVVILPEGAEAEAAEIVAAHPSAKPLRFASGGSSRPASTRAALALIGERAEETPVLFHDGVRPFLSQAIISRCLEALESAEAVATLVPAIDTVVMLDPSGTRIEAIPPRARLARNQTPQGFRLGTIRAAYAELTDADLARFTDDCGVVLEHNPQGVIAAVAGHEGNLKITHPQDIALAEQLLASGQSGADL